MKKWLLTCSLALAQSVHGWAQAPVQIEITDKVLQKDVTPLGICIGGGSVQKSAYLENFEGTLYRQCHEGTLTADGFVTKYAAKGTVDKYWGELGFNDNFYPGAKVMIISGPAYGQKTTIKELSFANDTFNQKTGEYLKFVFDKPIALPGGEIKDIAGILIDIDRSAEGCIPAQLGDNAWVSSNALLEHSDIPKDSNGKSALLLDATQTQRKYDRATKEWSDTDKKEAYFTCETYPQREKDNNGKWHLKFKAKNKEGCKLFIKPTGMMGAKTSTPPQDVPITSDWKEFEMTFDVKDIADPKDAKGNPMLAFSWTVPQGKVLLDDVEAWMESSDKNPTPFTDEYVNTMKKSRAGVIRMLQNAQMGGAMTTVLESGVRSIRSTNDVTKPVGPNSRRPLRAWSLGEHLQLCRETGAESWYVLPGTIYEEEMDLLMEFLGGPESTPGGKIRASQGEKEPWTKSVKKIHVEIGNEAWNTMFSFIAGGFNGPDYWQKLFERGKKSPYYSPNIVFHSAGQNYSLPMTKEVLTYTQKDGVQYSDRYAIAPYQIHDLDDAVLEPLKENGQVSKEKFAYWAMAYPFASMATKMKKQMDTIKPFGVEFSIYEVSWHITGKFAQDAKSPFVPIANDFVTTMPAGMGHINHMLMMLRDCGIRTQNSFCTFGNFYQVRLWGHFLSMKEGKERLRPTGICWAMANRAMDGNMMETKVSDNPTIEATGHFSGNKKGEHSTQKIPAVQSFAFKNGNKMHLVLMNFNLTQPMEIAVKTAGGKNVKSELAAPPSFDANNEFESDPEPAIKIQNLTLPNFSAEMKIKLPPASMQTVSWEI